ncbi:PTS mannitol transporter subunit IIA [Endozoicomonas sp. (ex Bugula neritina AB1)]|nr:PTS mannitol transporter subunit IIA [Endozoicomonas sp. (ex Bugula neritina AB1)]
MISQLLNLDRIKIVQSITDWKESIHVVAEPLIKDESISSQYVDSIFKSTYELGPYYVLAPKIAMPHARPHEGANKNALSLLIVKEGVSFHSEENDPVHLILLLSAQGSNEHIEIITSIADFFGNDHDIEKVIAAQSDQDILEILKQH